MNGERAQTIGKILGVPVSKDGVPTLHINMNSGAPQVSSQDFSPKLQAPACFPVQLPTESSSVVINSGKVLMNSARRFLLTLTF